MFFVSSLHSENLISYPNAGKGLALNVMVTLYTGDVVIFGDFVLLFGAPYLKCYDTLQRPT